MFPFFLTLLSWSLLSSTPRLLFLDLLRTHFSKKPQTQYDNVKSKYVAALRQVEDLKQIVAGLEKKNDELYMIKVGTHAHTHA